jgi:hypothetical protein
MSASIAALSAIAAYRRSIAISFDLERLADDEYLISSNKWFSFDRPYVRAKFSHKDFSFCWNAGMFGDSDWWYQAPGMGEQIDLYHEEGKV